MFHVTNQDLISLELRKKIYFLFYMKHASLTKQINKKKILQQKNTHDDSLPTVVYNA